MESNPVGLVSLKEATWTQTCVERRHRDKMDTNKPRRGALEQIPCSLLSRGNNPVTPDLGLPASRTARQ